MRRPGQPGGIIDRQLSHLIRVRRGKPRGQQPGAAVTAAGAVSTRVLKPPAFRRRPGAPAADQPHNAHHLRTHSPRRFSKQHAVILGFDCPARTSQSGFRGCEDDYR
jgi:hypothetical protein